MKRTKLRLLVGSMLLTTLIGGVNASTPSLHKELKQPVDYVDPYIGTSGHGHVFLGANVPFGYVQLGPTQYTRGWDWCSGYHYSDSILIGFGHQHLSGTGIGDLGDISFLPVTQEGMHELRFSHQNETARPGYYALSLPDYRMKVELTATTRCGFHRYTFDKDTQPLLRLNLQQGIGWDKWDASEIRQLNDSTLVGYRYSKGWAALQKVFFAAKFSRPIVKLMQKGDSIATLAFTPNQAPLLVKVGLSAVSTENALANLQTEIPRWSFDAVRESARNEWNKQLGRIEIETKHEDRKTVFYTALYHTMIAPSVFSDINGDYRGADGKVYKANGFTNYTTFSLWDTYRALHPLFTLIFPELQYDIAQTFMHIFKQQGKLPVWHLMGNETDCMAGNPGAIVLADLITKGYLKNKNDILQAYEAMKQSSMLDERSLGLLKKYGYIPYDLEPAAETVSKNMEYAVADNGVAQIAKMLNKQADYRYFFERSKAYRKYFDPKVSFVRGLDSKGKFRTPFDPFLSMHGKGDFMEGNSWQYTWMAPHDPHGLINLFDSEQHFVNKLDSLFVVEGDMGEEASPDVSGLIGQYAHGNEPSHHTVYLYHYAGRPWKAAPLLRKIMNELYTTQNDGLCGNEDVGQMSAWYILSSIGLYQVEPVGGKFVIGSPLFDRVKIHLGNNKTFTLTAEGNSDQAIYVKQAQLKGKAYPYTYIRFDELMKGGELRLQMTDKQPQSVTPRKYRP